MAFTCYAKRRYFACFIAFSAYMRIVLIGIRLPFFAKVIRFIIVESGIIHTRCNYIILKCLSANNGREYVVSESKMLLTLTMTE